MTWDLLCCSPCQDSRKTWAFQMLKCSWNECVRNTSIEWQSYSAISCQNIQILLHHVWLSCASPSWGCLASSHALAVSFKGIAAVYGVPLANWKTKSALHAQQSAKSVVQYNLYWRKPCLSDGTICPTSWSLLCWFDFNSEIMLEGSDT